MEIKNVSDKANNYTYDDGNGVVLIYVGNNIIDSAYLGNTPIDKIYIGTILVYEV